MKRFYCTNEKNNCYKVKYNVVINISPEDTNNTTCPECGFPIKEIPPTLVESAAHTVQKNIKFILPTFIIIIGILIAYLLYEPRMDFKNTPITKTIEDQKYRHEILIVNEKENAKINIIEKPRWLIYDQSKRVLSGTPRNAQVGKHNVHIIVYVENKDTTHQQFSIEVQNTNDSPTLVNHKSIGSAEEDSSYTQNLIFSDVDGDSSYVLYINPSNQWLKVKNNTLYGTPNKDDKNNNITKFTIFFSDGHDTSNQTINIPIVLGNQPPKYNGRLSKDVKENRRFTQEFNTRGKYFSDVDGDDIVLTFDLPDFLEERQQGKTYTIIGTPTQSDVGTHTITMNYTDQITTTQKAVYTLTVLAVNDAPIFLSPNRDISIVEGDDFSYQIKFSDPEKDNVSIEIIKKPTWITYAPDTQTLFGISEKGTHELVIKLIDTEGATTETSLNVFVDLSGNAKNALKWTPILYQNYLKKKKTVKTTIEIEKLITEIQNLELLDELKEKFNISGSSAKFYIIDPNDIFYNKDEFYFGDKCFLVHMSKKRGVKITTKENYKIPESGAPIYVIK